MITTMDDAVRRLLAKFDGFTIDQQAKTYAAMIEEAAALRREWTQQYGDPDMIAEKLRALSLALGVYDKEYSDRYVAALPGDETFAPLHRSSILTRARDSLKLQAKRLEDGKV